MVNDFININKTNNHISPKFTKYKKTLEIHAGLRQPQNCGDVKYFNEIATLPGKHIQRINKRLKNLHRFASTYYHKNERQHNMNSTEAGSINNGS